MEQREVTDRVSGFNDIHEDDSTIYLFGSELYCGWCLESFTCPVRLKIHCHIEHLATCSCGEQFCDKQSLCEHVVSAGCLLPPPFHWSHFVNLPCGKLNDVHITETPEGGKQHQSHDESETEDEKSSKKAVKSIQESIQNTNAVGKRKTLLKEHEQKGNGESSLQGSKQGLFCCEMCPFQSLYRQACKRHIQRKHGKKPEKYMYWNSCDKVSEKSKHDTTVGDAAVVGSLNKASPVHSVPGKKALVAEPGHVNPSLASSESCCEKHRSNDIQFIISCFSWPVGGKPLCCDLCSGKFEELEEAAVHIYNAHFSTLQRWRDTHAVGDTCADVGDTQALTENSSDDVPADNAVADQSETLSSAVECSDHKSNNSVYSEKLQPKLSEHSSVSLEHNSSSDTFVDRCKIHLPETETKRKFTDDECKVLASSLCKLLDCCNGEPETEMPAGKAMGTHDAKVKATASPPKKSPSAARPNRAKITVREMVARRCKFCRRVCSNKFNCQRHEVACRLTFPSSSSLSEKVARKCKFCHTVYSNRSNCRRHEVTCRRTFLSSRSARQKSGIETKQTVQQQTTNSTSEDAVRKINGKKVFYCTRCGFSDSDQQVVNAHLLEPHVRGKLQVKAQPGHDYIGSMKVGSGNFHCTVCGASKNSRPKMLLHLQSHSAPAVEMVSVRATNTKSPSDKVPENSKEQSSGFVTAGYARSCPKCSRSFSSVAKYLSHRTVCRAVQHRDEIRRPGQLHYLFNFCQESLDGRWNCRLCKQSSRHRFDLYRHIRTKHSEVQSVKVEADNESKSSPKSQKTADGLQKYTKHKSTAVNSRQQKPGAEHFTKPCPNCSRTFTNSVGYMNHIMRFCGKLVCRFVEPVANSSRIRCGLCHQTYSTRSVCMKHLRRKHHVLMRNMSRCH